MSFYVNAQITLEHTYITSHSSLQIIHLSNSGYKYYAYDTASLTLYNTNHSLWKKISITIPNSGYRMMNILHISETLFNTDGNIEFLCVFYKYFQNLNNSGYIIDILDESGNIIQNVVNYHTFGISPPAPQIVFDGINYKLLISHDDSTKVYSLPGTLPCGPCSGYSGVKSNEKVYSSEISSPYPNPSGDETTINYTLPREERTGKIVLWDSNGKLVKEYLVDHTFNELHLSNADLSSGTYFYQLQTANGISGSKKMVVIR